MEVVKTEGGPPGEAPAPEKRPREDSSGPADALGQAAGPGAPGGVFWLPKSNQDWEKDPETARPKKKAAAAAAAAPAPKPKSGFASGFASTMTSWTGATQSSSYRGVSWSKSMKKWQAYILTGGKNNTIGYFESEEEAARIRDDRARQQDGVLATFNFPREGEMGLLADAREQQKQDHRIRSVRQCVEALVSRVELENAPKDEHGNPLEDESYAGAVGGERSRRTRRKTQTYEPGQGVSEAAAASRQAVGPSKEQREWMPLWARLMPGAPAGPSKPETKAGKGGGAAIDTTKEPRPTATKCHWRKLGGQWLLSKYGGKRQHIGSDKNSHAVGRATLEATQRMSRKGSVRQRPKPKAERTWEDLADEHAANELAGLLQLASNLAPASYRAAAAAAAAAGNVDDEWVQCDLPSCAKWRRLPPHIKAADLPQRFICSMISWGEKSLARCDAPEESAVAAPAPATRSSGRSTRSSSGGGRRSSSSTSSGGSKNLGFLTAAGQPAEPSPAAASSAASSPSSSSTAVAAIKAGLRLCEDCGVQHVDLRRKGNKCNECGKKNRAKYVALGRPVPAPTSAPQGAVAEADETKEQQEARVKKEMELWHSQRQQAWEQQQQQQQQQQQPVEQQQPPPQQQQQPQPTMILLQQPPPTMILQQQ